MPEYRAFIIGQDGQFKDSEVILADDDEHAVKLAGKLVDDNIVEVWHLERRIATRPSTS